MSTKASQPPRVVDVPVVIGRYFGIIGFACLIAFIGPSVLLIALWTFLAAIAVGAILAIPLVLNNGVSHLRVAKSEQNDLLREISREHLATLRHAEAQMLATYIAAVDIKARLVSVDSDSPAHQETLADLQAALDRIAIRMEPLSNQVDAQLRKAKIEALRWRLHAAIEFAQEQLKPYPTEKIGHQRSLWRLSQEACERVAKRLEAVSASETWDEQLKTVLGFEQLRSIQEQFAQLGDWPQGPAPGVVMESGPPAGTGLYEYTKAQKAAEKSLEEWRRQLEE